MHKTVQNLINIKNEIKTKLIDLNLNYHPNIIAVSKTFSIQNINPLIEYGHIHFGENKVQEAVNKWSEIKEKNNQIILHMVGKLQTNKVKYAVKLFDYIHSLDNLKLAKKISDEQKKYEKKPKLFIQINLGNEEQKSGITLNKFEEFYNYCKKIELNIVGLMCLPPENQDSNFYFSELQKITKEFQFDDTSMGMSSDYINAIKFRSTFLRIGSKIFGART
tara:strand:+ start:387 stop:1046 length:660 start_codon:yes stop_codon:yes gene_type:complete